MAVLRRPKLKKREPDVQSSWTPPGSASQPAPQQRSTYVPSPSAESSGRGISVRELNEALGLGSGAGGEGGSLLSGVGGTPGGGINTRDLGAALTGSGAAAGNRSSESTRHTSYPQGKGDLRALPAKAGTRRGPRTTSYRIPLQRNSQANVFDTIN